jgi:CheY-like chemotaxis protein/HPt (histidine-containing phosphotransfer) domain-containing protein
VVTIRKVLLVDDEPDIRRVGELSLRAVGGWRVVLADSGSKVVALARTERPDVILLDVMMPDVDGPTTLELLRADPDTRSIPVVFLSARVMRDGVDHYLSLGAAGVLAKPFDPMSLAADLTRILAGAPKAPRVDLAPEMDTLRAELGALLPARIAELSSLVLAALASPDEAARLAARSAAHRLAGTAGSYGFTDVGDAASGIELELDRLRAFETRSTCITAICDWLSRMEGAAARSGE